MVVESILFKVDRNFDGSARISFYFMSLKFVEIRQNFLSNNKLSGEKGYY